MNSKLQGLFITGTDTGVGKTFFGVWLARELTAHGIRVRVRKPLESGCVGNFPADAAQLQAAAGSYEPLERICPWPLVPAISPERAALQLGLHLQLTDLTAACSAAVEYNDFLLVEGAGGFFSPLTPGVRNAELAVALGLPIVLIVADRLGCLNHALLTVEAITARQLHLSALILNEYNRAIIPAMDNHTDLERWLGITPYCFANCSHFLQQLKINQLILNSSEK